MKVGLLALQGNYEAHRKILSGEIFRGFDCKPLLVSSAEHLRGVSALVIPGGESTTMLKLLTPELREALVSELTSGMPCLATCAGLILLAARVRNPQQQSLNVLDVDVTRNAYGRQDDSFIDPQLTATDVGRGAMSSLADSGTCEGVFIRAPRIDRVGKNVETLLEHHGQPVLVKQGNILGATFHPEMSSGDPVVHKLLLKLVSDRNLS